MKPFLLGERVFSHLFFGPAFVVQPGGNEFRYTSLVTVVLSNHNRIRVLPKDLVRNEWEVVRKGPKS